MIVTPNAIRPMRWRYPIHLKPSVLPEERVIDRHGESLARCIESFFQPRNRLYYLIERRGTAEDHATHFFVVIPNDVLHPIMRQNGE